jgi:glycosyltransferase involved in cell wall biosynthesis
MARNLEVENHVTFAGFIAYEDARLVQILNTSDICVCTDRKHVATNCSTAMKIMEYMALAKPIVQFDLKEGRYSAEDAALYAEPDNPIDLGEKILELLDDPGRRAEMGRKGRERVESSLAWSHQAAKLLAAYEALHKT